MNSVDRINAIDGIKGIAACVVAFFWHYRHFIMQIGLLPIYKPCSFLFEYGWLMVEVFFVLSGFGMMAGYRERISNNEISFKDFIYGRIKKLYVLHIITLVLVAVLQYLHLRRMGHYFIYPANDVLHFVLNILLLQNGVTGTKWSFNSPSWYVSVLLQICILFFWLVKWIKTERKLYLSFLAAVIAGALLVVSQWEGAVLNVLIGRGLMAFFLGALLYAMYDAVKGRYEKAAGCAFSAVFVISAVIIWKFRNSDGAIPHLVFALAFLPSGLMVGFTSRLIRKVMENKLFLFLGGISTYIYMLHYPVQCVIKVCDVYLGPKCDYSSMGVWLAYVMAVIITAFVVKTKK